MASASAGETYSPQLFEGGAGCGVQQDATRAAPAANHAGHMDCNAVGVLIVMRFLSIRGAACRLRRPLTTESPGRPLTTEPPRLTNGLLAPLIRRRLSLGTGLCRARLRGRAHRRLSLCTCRSQHSSHSCRCSYKRRVLRFIFFAVRRYCHVISGLFTGNNDTTGNDRSLLLLLLLLLTARGGKRRAQHSRHCEQHGVLRAGFS